ncbi:F-box domain containing protein [Quillaja saponaria]|uniref:F-box domain containing protein n=1 Tax=Quillaja saponaria TaxID=32244 RepID=A0AAD7PQM5_QUISA|nr:F-box domain containing protein [Quillaja saponaria]
MVLGDEGLDTLVNKWMGLLVEIQVNELYYRTLLPTRSRPQWKIFPEVIAAESITVINLFGCKLENASTGSGIKFRYLREVVLEQVYLDEKMIQDFNDSCLLIKLFSLRHCKGFKIFHLNGLPKLKKVLLDVLEFVEVQMRTPSLQFCNLHMGFGYQGKIDLTACQCLKSLIVRGAFITDLLLQEFTSRLLLETLELYHCDMGEMVIISSHRLKHLILFHAKDAIEIMIDTPNLLSFQYSGSIIPCISSINPSCQRDAAFSLYNNHVLDALWLLKLHEFVGVCRQTKVLNLSIMTDEINVSFPNIEEEDWIRLIPYEIEHLKLHIPSFTKLNFAVLVNGLFQSCRPKLVSVKTIYEDGIEFICSFKRLFWKKKKCTAAVLLKSNVGGITYQM